ncbi:TonB-dependent receptor [Achromobacter sp. GG226]|uniref:TonB-dependent receptor n=1 Tax=Verticiella alkaliphila TaxID=2779529 RepID=UPI001C0CB71C|nr:TonB-dependent receptor [Verticiella sp. GG226]MBU4610667.1 TonB-dependent receptor [Verticiella sp. GG226]
MPPYAKTRHRAPAALLLAAPALCLAQAQPQPATAAGGAYAGTLAPVVVSSTRTETIVFDTPASVDSIDGDTMRDRQPQVDLAESLTGLAGMQIQDRQNDAQDLQISIRGFGARSSFGVRGVRLYVDGIPATMPDGQGQTSNIEIATTDRVEVLRGPFSALYGNASGGVIQVFTRDGERPPSVGASFAAGSHGMRRYGLTAQGANDTGAGVFDYTLGVNRTTTDGYRDHSASRRNQANAKLNLQLDDDRRLTIIANHVDLSAQDPLGLTRAQFDDTPRVAPLAQQYNTRKTVRQTQGGLRYEHRVTTDDTLSAMLYVGTRSTQQFLSIPPAPQQSPLHAGGVIDLERDYAGADLRWTAERQLAGQALTLIGGVAYDQMREDRQGYLNYVDTPAGRELGVMGALRRDETNRVRNLDPYVQGSWAFAPRWTLDAGVRWSHIRFRSNDHYIVGVNGDDSGDARYRKLLPMAALRFAATEDLNLYAAVGRGFETPTLNEISYRADGQAGLNFDLRPATNTSVELGAKAAIAGGTLTAAVFQTRTEDEIVTAVASGGRSTFQNAGRTRRHGAELSWAGALVGDWQLRASYAWLDARYRDDVCAPAACGQNPIVSGNRIPGIARHTAFAALDWAPPEGWRAGVDVRYQDQVFVNDANEDAAPSYLVAGASVGYRWRQGPWSWDAFGRVDNLFDRKYAGSVIVNDGNGRFFESAPGRNWSAGMGASYAF